MSTILLPPEVMRMILANLERRDLLCCRLINRSWKEECTYLLSKSDTCIRLNPSNTRQYRRFVKSCKYQISSLQLDLHFENTLWYWTWSSIEKGLGELSSQAYKLTSVLGLDAIKKLTLHTPIVGAACSMSFKALVQLLSKVSAGLECLDLSDFRLTCSAKENLDKDEYQLTLPKLNKCCIWAGSKAAAELVEMCTNLNSLNIRQYFETPCKNLFRMITRLDVGGRWRYPELLRGIQSSAFVPQIQKFGLEYYNNRSKDEVDEIIEQILKAFAHSLKSLTVTVFNCSGAGLEVHFSYPNLPILQHFELKRSDNYRNPAENKIHFFKLNPSKLPSLTSVEFPLNWTFMQVDQFNSDNFSSLRHPSLLFPNVKSLSLGSNGSKGNVWTTRLNFEWFDMDGALRTLKPLLDCFPNVNNVTIVNFRLSIGQLQQLIN